MDSCIVTCLYDGLEGTPYGGRTRYTMYSESLLSISKVGVPIYCYVFEKDYQPLKDFFYENSANNIQVLIHDIFQEDFHEKIMEIKNKYPEKYLGEDIFWKTRCPEIMYSKHRLMMKTMLNNPSYKYMFWIDAGLSNSSVMRHKFFPRLSQHDHHTSEGIFTPNFIKNLIKYSEGEILAMLHTRPNNFRIPQKYNKLPYDGQEYAMIAGIFGGEVNKLKWFSKEIDRYIENMLEDKILFSEESIYTGIVNDNKNNFSTFIFDTFYNEDWGHAYSHSRISFAEVIDRLI